MTIHDDICRALWAGFTVREVPMGLAVSTPVAWFTGDNIGFYIRLADGRARIEDSGLLVFDLEAQGIPASRPDYLARLIKKSGECKILFSEEFRVFHTEWVPENQVAAQALPFLNFLSRLQNQLCLG